MGKNKDQSTALVKLDAYPLLLQPPEEATELILHNMGGTLNVDDLSRIKMPSGGGKAYEIPCLDGVRFEEEFENIILYRQSTINKAYWKSSIVSNDPPDCRSHDGVVGVGNPGGLCADCPFNKFGSAIDPQGNPSAGKACKDSQMIFPLLEGDSLPYAMNLPPTSLRPFGSYCSMLTKAALPYYSAISKIGIQPATSKGGTTYSQASFRVSRDENKKMKLLSPDQVADLRLLIYGDRDHSGLSAQLEKIQATEDDYGDGQS